MKIKHCFLFFLLDDPFIFECIEVLECFRAWLMIALFSSHMS